MNNKHWINKEYNRPRGMCIVGGYSLDLYCANPVKGHAYNADSLSIGGKTKQECYTQARNIGWYINESLDIAICPQCVKREKQK